MNQDSFAANRKLIEALKEQSRAVCCNEGRILFSRGDAPVGLYLVENGEAALVTTSASGQVVMCLHVGAGSLLGLPAIIGNEPYSLTSMARKGSEIRFVTRGHDSGGAVALSICIASARDRSSSCVTQLLVGKASPAASNSKPHSLRSRNCPSIEAANQFAVELGREKTDPQLSFTEFRSGT